MSLALTLNACGGCSICDIVGIGVHVVSAVDFDSIGGGVGGETVSGSLSLMLLFLMLLSVLVCYLL